MICPNTVIAKFENEVHASQLKYLVIAKYILDN